MLEDTIIAVATPPGFGGLGRRPPRKRARSARGSQPADLRAPRTGRAEARSRSGGRPSATVRDPEGGAGLGRGLPDLFRGAAGPTRGEDVVEISAHGSPAVLEAVLAAWGRGAGARPARSGRVHPAGPPQRAAGHPPGPGRGRPRPLGLPGPGPPASRRASSAAASVAARGAQPRRTGLVARLSPGSRPAASSSRRSGSWTSARGRPQGALDRLAADDRPAGRRLRGRPGPRPKGVTLALVRPYERRQIDPVQRPVSRRSWAIVTPYPRASTRAITSGERLVIDGVAVRLVDMAGLGRASHPCRADRGIAWDAGRSPRGADGRPARPRRVPPGRPRGPDGSSAATPGKKVHRRPEQVRSGPEARRGRRAPPGRPGPRQVLESLCPSYQVNL
ncbi:MAG: hypothetical protein MZU95_13310 [Desulfomicrobium escambiense]|nr:hypothetical protein [Desulfomicrobium escambiense]